MNKIQYQDKTLTLIEEAHCDVGINVDYQWMAYATDEEENEYIVTWQEKEEFDGVDCSEACDWDNYEIIEL